MDWGQAKCREVVHCTASWNTGSETEWAVSRWAINKEKADWQKQNHFQLLLKSSPLSSLLPSLLPTATALARKSAGQAAWMFRRDWHLLKLFNLTVRLLHLAVLGATWRSASYLSLKCFLGGLWLPASCWRSCNATLAEGAVCLIVLQRVIHLCD